MTSRFGPLIIVGAMVGLFAGVQYMDPHPMPAAVPTPPPPVVTPVYHVRGPYGGSDSAAEACAHNAMLVATRLYPDDPGLQAFAILEHCEKPIRDYLSVQGVDNGDFRVDWADRYVRKYPTLPY